MNPLHIPEIVDHCVGFLAQPDLCSCALVSRSWVYLAQSHLFSEIIIEASLSLFDLRAPPLLDVLEASPHLAGYILTLYNEEPLSPHDYLRLGNIPCTRLSSLHIGRYSTLPSEGAVAIQQLLSLPALVSVVLKCTFETRDQFLRIWKHCSPSIKHLSLISRFDNQTAPLVDPGHASTGSRHIMLDSFQTDSIGNVQWWLNDSRCPLNFSALKALKYAKGPDFVPFGRLSQALKTVEVLTMGSQSADLSAFERLTDLRLLVHRLTPFLPLRTLPTIHPASRARLRVLRFNFIIAPYRDTPRAPLLALCGQVDRALADLPARDHFPNLALVHITVIAATPALTMGADSEDYFSLLDPGIELQWSTHFIQCMICRYKASLFQISARKQRPLGI
ncbi:hypothetical protein FB451DRAFT_1255479, partial [Mycena latifolia]